MMASDPAEPRQSIPVETRGGDLQNRQFCGLLSVSKRSKPGVLDTSGAVTPINTADALFDRPGGREPVAQMACEDRLFASDRDSHAIRR